MNSKEKPHGVNPHVHLSCRECYRMLVIPADVLGVEVEVWCLCGCGYRCSIAADTAEEVTVTTTAVIPAASEGPMSKPLNLTRVVWVAAVTVVAGLLLLGLLCWVIFH